MFEKLESKHFEDYEYPKVTIVIPTKNNDEKISSTIESVLFQKYPAFELIVVDAGSTDRTPEVVKNYRDDRVKFFSMTNDNPYEMLNFGITHGSGVYFNFLFPGDYYTTTEALRYIMGLAIEHSLLSMVFCGTLLRDGITDPRVLYRPFRLRILAKGQQPTSLQSCWFHMKVFETIGKFDSGYKVRGGYDLMCRIAFRKELSIFSTSRVLTDYDLRNVTRQNVIDHFNETLHAVYRYFGFLRAVRWLFFQKDLGRLFKMWLRNVKLALFGN